MDKLHNESMDAMHDAFQGAVATAHKVYAKAKKKVKSVLEGGEYAKQMNARATKTPEGRAMMARIQKGEGNKMMIEGLKKRFLGK